MASPIFRKYIGGTGTDTVLDNVLGDHLKKMQPLHLVFRFADDCCDGPFGTNWSKNYEPILRRICDLKSTAEEYKEAKVIFSIGDNYNPKPGVPSSENWVGTATDNISDVLETYKFDGLDLSYSNISDNSKDTFVKNMAGVFRGLRNKSEGKIFSITPTPTFDDCYSKLYSELTYNGELKDKISSKTEEKCFDILVNYKFYVNTTKGALRNTLDFKASIKEVLQKYPGAKLLMGYSADQNNIGIPEEQVFVETYRQLKDHLSGIFVWSDNTSACSVEMEAEKLLASAGQPGNRCGCICRCRL